MPAYNHEDYIADAVRSVLDQTHSDLELIIIDDGSTDNTRRILRGFSDSRVRYQYQENQGAHRALNKGISLATGDVIAILNSDDVYLPNRLEKCLAYLQLHPDVAAVLTRVAGIDAKGKPLRKHHSPHIKAWMNWYKQALKLFKSDAFFPNTFSKNILITTSNLVIRKSAFGDVGGFAALRYAHDWDMLIRLSSLFNLHLMDEILLEYRIHDANTVHEDNSEAKVRFEVNWLILENIRRLSNSGQFPEYMEHLLRENHYVSFDALMLMAVSDLNYNCEDGFSLRDPITHQLLEMLKK